MKSAPRTPAKTSDTLGHGMDFALVTLVFFGLGYALDRWLGTRPLFMIGLILFSMVGQFTKMWFDYDGAMRRHEAERLAARHQRSAATGAPTPTGEHA